MVNVRMSLFDAEVILHTLVSFREELINCDFDTVTNAIDLITDKLSAAISESNNQVESDG